MPQSRGDQPGKILDVGFRGDISPIETASSRTRIISLCTSVMGPASVYPCCDRPRPPPTAVPSKESFENQKCAPSCESVLATPETTPRSAVQSGAPISSPTSSHLLDRRNREPAHKSFPPQDRPNPIRKDLHQIGALYRITIYRGNQWTLSSAVIQAAPGRSYRLRVSFRQIPRRQFANEISSAVVAMEAPPV
jgi:hypothetical protein